MAFSQLCKQSGGGEPHDLGTQARARAHSVRYGNSEQWAGGVPSLPSLGEENVFWRGAAHIPAAATAAKEGTPTNVLHANWKCIFGLTFKKKIKTEENKHNLK